MQNGIIYYDITDVLGYAQHNHTLSGIQRFSIEILSLLVEKHGTERIKIIAFHPKMRKVLTYDSAVFLPPHEYSQKNYWRTFSIGGTQTFGIGDIESYLATKYKTRWRRRYHTIRLMTANIATAGRTFRKRDITDNRYRNTYPPLAGRPPVFSPGDIIFVPGATWNYEYYINFLADARKKHGVRFFQFIHDLIPLTSPEYVVNDVPEHFLQWLKFLGANADCFLTNSKATKTDLDAWLVENKCAVSSRVVRLAHQFCGQARVTSPSKERAETTDIRAEILNAARLPYVLCVGTIEPRKNNWTLANAWKDIYEKRGPDAIPRLIFAGKKGWLSSDFDDFIAGSGSLYGFIRIINRPTDRELAFLYKKCLFSMFVSYKEGWGLPIGEGLWFGRPVICSNVSSMPEVGGELAEYVDPMSIGSLANCISRLISDVEYREEKAKTIMRANLRTWADVSDDLWTELTRHPDHEFAN